MADLTLYELPPSPNNLRARLALKYKGLSYETRVVPFGSDRSELVALSTQPLTPVLKHGEVIVFDSSAILRYLDANFPNTPQLFSATREGMRAIEEWEYFARTQLIEPIGIMFDQAFAQVADEAKIREANELMHEHTGRIERTLGEGGPWLLGERLTAADLFAAPLVATTAMPADSEVGVVAFFGKHLSLGEERDQTRDWLDRVLAFDR